MYITYSLVYKIFWRILLKAGLLEAQKSRILETKAQKHETWNDCAFFCHSVVTDQFIFSLNLPCRNLSDQSQAWTLTDVINLPQD